MSSGGGVGAAKSPKLDAIVDSTLAMMLEEGYASVTYRGVAARAGVAAGLVQYYFPSLDDLFIAVLRRRTDELVEQLTELDTARQPLRAVWDYASDRTGTALLMEFMALANHRKAIRAVIAESSRRFRRAELDTLTAVLERYGLDPERWPAASVILVLSSISRFLLIEEAFDLDIGHAETEALVEGHIRALEGDRIGPPPEPPRPRRQRRATPTR
jgi:AcrR family transcriptional regulator